LKNPTKSALREKESKVELTKKARTVVDAIEACGASPELTHAVTLASDLATDIEFMELREVAVEKGWNVPSANNPFPKHSWTWYWRNCMAYEKDPSIGRPVPPHR